MKHTRNWLTRRRLRAPAIAPLEVVACVIGISALAWLSDLTAPAGAPLLIPSLAATAVLLFISPGQTSARSWNAIGGQTLSAVAGFACYITLGEHYQWLAIGFAAGLALAVMRAARCLHAPGAATAVIMVVSPDPLIWEHIFFPVAAGTILIVGWAWVVHYIEDSFLTPSTSSDES